ncbi:hypothetical protein ACET3Z_016317 [Daucus carota]
MNTDITASTKPEYPVVDRNPPFTKTVANFNTLDYLRLTTISGVAITVGYLSGIKPNIRGPSMVTGGLIGVMGGFMYAYQNSAGRLMGFFPNEDAITKILPCEFYLLGIGSPSAPCCQAVAQLSQLASSKPELKSLCVCLKQAAQTFHVIADKAKQLPGLCHVTTPVPIDPNINCDLAKIKKSKADYTNLKRAYRMC